MQIRHKFHAKPERLDEQFFASKKEREYYQSLLLARKSGDLLFFLRQVPFHLPGGVTYRLDFCEFWKDGSVRFVDVKGFRTETYIAKKKLVEAIYPIEILEG